jgi:hypothetical protein
MAPRFGTRRTLKDFAPDVVHIATEGPIGWSARGWCKSTGTPFTTAFHTRFPDYAAVRTGLDASHFWPVMRRFHNHSRAVLVSTPTLAGELAAQGIGRARLWSRGIDRSLFHPQHDPLPEMAALPGPVMLYVGRVAVEKNLKPSSPARCPAARSWSATAPISSACAKPSPKRPSWARWRASSWRGPIARRKSSCSPAGPTPSASS